MKRTNYLGLSFISLVSIIMFGCGGSTDLADLKEKADAAIEDGDLAEAESILRFALKETPQDAQLLARAGKVYVMQGRLRDAFKVLSIVTQLNPNDSESLASLASIKLAAGMRDQALTDARSALEKDPSHPEAPLILAELAESIEAVAQTKSWLESLSPTPAIHSAIGALYLKARNLALADQHFDEAIKLDPESPLGYAGKFQIYNAQNKPEQALAMLEKAAERAPYRSGLRLHYAKTRQDNEGDQAAREVVDHILKNAPDYLPALTFSAELAATAGDAKTAKAHVKRALQLDPIDPTALRVSGTLSVLDQKIDEAITQLGRALELYPKDLKSNFQMALAYLAKRDIQNAITRLRTVVSINPNHLESNILLATIQMENEDVSGAIITLRDFLTQNSNSVQGYLLLAEAYTRSGNNDAALAIYKSLESAKPGSAELSYLSGLSQLRKSNNSAARSAFESALESNPVHLQSVEQLSALDVIEQNFEAALARIDQTIESSPEKSALHTIRARILHSMGNDDEAVNAFKRSIELDPENATTRTLYARLLEKLDDKSGSIDQLNKILETNPNHVETLLSLGSNHERAKRFDRASEAYHRILEVDEENPTALNNLAHLYSTYFDDIDKAFELAERARAQAPDSPFTADTLGWIVYKRGDYRWAMSLLADAYSKLPGNPEVAYHLASTHYMLGNEPQSTELFRVATSSELGYLGFDDAKRKAAILAINPQTAGSNELEVLKSHIETYPQDAMALLKKANIAKKQSDYEEAQKHLKNVLQLVPDNVSAMISLGEIEYSKGNYQDAQELAQKAIAARTNNADATLLLGNVALKTKQYSWAISVLQELLDSNSDNPELQLALGEAHYQLGESDKAQKFLSVTAERSNNESQKTLAQSLIRILKTDTNTTSLNAKQALEERLKLEPEDANAIATLATLKIREGKLDEARTDFERALQLSPENRLAKLGLAEVLVEKSEDASRAYALASAALSEPSIQNRAIAIQALSLFQQEKNDLGRTQAKDAKLERLPASLSETLSSLLQDS